MDDKIKNFKPIIGVLIIVFTLFLIVFVKMEMRHQGYQLLKLMRELSQLKEEEQLQVMQLAKKRRPQFVEQLAKSNFTLKNAGNNQIILLTDSKLVIDRTDKKGL